MTKSSAATISLTAIGLTAGAAVAYQLFKPRYDFADKVILITGGSRGLGLVLAREFADRGARIAICARDRDEVQRAKEDLESRGAEVFDAPINTPADGEHVAADERPESR